MVVTRPPGAAGVRRECDRQNDSRDHGAGQTGCAQSGDQLCRKIHICHPDAVQGLGAAWALSRAYAAKLPQGGSARVRRLVVFVSILPESAPLFGELGRSGAAVIRPRSIRTGASRRADPRGLNTSRRPGRAWVMVA